MSQRNIPASVRTRLLNKARAEKRDFTLVLTRYALERLLYRISISRYVDRFWLKGALLFDLWFDLPFRPTRDLDLLGFGPAELHDLTTVFQELCAVNVEDGIYFDARKVQAEEIRKEANYAGIRITLPGWIDSAHCPVQVDIGYGDIVTPAPDLVDYPVLLPEFPAPRLRAYPRYTVVAEKLEALITLGIANSRMKDFFDLWVLAKHSEFEGELLRTAIRATLARRETPIPDDTPFGLTAAFANDAQKQRQWQGFLSKNRLSAPPLQQILDDLASFLMPVLESASQNLRFDLGWSPATGFRLALPNPGFQPGALGPQTLQGA